MTSDMQDNPTPQETEDGMSFAEMLARQEQDDDAIRLEPGQKVKVRIVAITADTIFVSTGSKVDGIVDRAELEVDGELPCQVGDYLELYVITANSHEVKLSRAMHGDGGLAALEDARDAKMPVEGRVTAQVKGGYSVDIMKRRAFCPMSQMDIRPISDPEIPVGQTYSFLITKLENKGRNIVVSRRDLLERERAESLEKILAELHEGDICEGAVSRLMPFGAFIELAPGVEGMAHVSELSWSRIDQPEEAVKLGDKVKVKILSIAKEDKGLRISLSLKAATADPWLSLGDHLRVGDVVNGKVVRLAPFGVFVELLPGIDGLVHLSELSYAKRVNKAEEVVAAGDVVSVKVKEIDQGKRRISLSLRDAAGDPWAQVNELFSVGQDVAGTVESRAQFGLFINLAPAITGLLANPVIKASPRKKDLERLAPGDSVNVRIREIDTAGRRISLLPAGEEDAGAVAAESANWREHAPKPAAEPAMGSLGMALQAAKAKKEGKK